MEAAVAAEDYVTAAAERDAVDALMLRRRKLEVLASAEARKVLYRPGERAGLLANRFARNRGIMWQHRCARSLSILHHTGRPVIAAALYAKLPLCPQLSAEA